jgi:ABC-type transport system involved in cytochrome c biogenesis permease subunit
MSEVMKHPVVVGEKRSEAEAPAWRSYLPAILAVGGAVLMVLLRIKLGPAIFISDGALMMLGLACYLTAAVFHLTNLYAPSEWAQRLGLWLATAGVFFNISSWGVRWINARDHELAILMGNGGEMPWFFRYIPFSNLYDLSLAFAFGAGVTTLLIAHRKSFRFLGALTLPLASLILLLARFIGDDLIELQPILDSYWRPIHVGIASMSYGVALVCFAIAVMYLLKDKTKPESMAIWASIFGLAITATVSRFSVLNPFQHVYRASTVITGSRQSIPLRVDIPMVGPLLILTALLLVGVIVSFGFYLAKQDEQARVWGHRLLKLAFVGQACAIATLVTQIKTMTGVGARALQLFQTDPSQALLFGRWIAEQEGLKPDQIAQTGQDQLIQAALGFAQQKGSMLGLSLNANPVELAALITVFAGLLFVILFSFRTEKLRDALPPLDKLDSLMYKTAGVTFAMLCMLLITGAVWANESWGAYWSWDSKEVGALVAALTYAAYLHTRIARGWTGRRSAYFAIVGFLLVIFTYLGVSYLLPGLHSYA